MSDIEGKVTRVGSSEREQRTSFKIVCCNFCKELFLTAAWRSVDKIIWKPGIHKPISLSGVNFI